MCWSGKSRARTAACWRFRSDQQYAGTAGCGRLEGHRGLGVGSREFFRVLRQRYVFAGSGRLPSVDLWVLLKSSTATPTLSGCSGRGGIHPIPRSFPLSTLSKSCECIYPSSCLTAILCTVGETPASNAVTVTCLLVLGLMAFSGAGAATRRRNMAGYALQIRTECFVSMARLLAFGRSRRR